MNNKVKQDKTGEGNAPRVRIHDLSGYAPFRVYEAATESDCYGETDRSVFREVIRSGEVITMGKTIGEPIGKAVQ